MLVLAFIYVPIALIVIYAFNAETTPAWPPVGFSLRLVGPGVPATAASSSVPDLDRGGALAATAIALVLGTLASFAVPRHQFFGRESISFVVVLPIALPGIVTGMALNTTFRTSASRSGSLAIIVGHATFCVVIVYNNVLARLRRVSVVRGGVHGPGRRPVQTFRHVTFPAIRTALLAGGRSRSRCPSTRSS